MSSRQSENSFYFDEDAPEGRCGLTTDYDNRDFPGNMTCWRETWEENRGCIWHARVRGKSTEGLHSSRTGKVERLDGCFLPQTRIAESLDLTGCYLVGADFSETEFQEANLSGTNLCRADFSGAKLNRAGLSEAILWDADFSEANLRNAKLSGAEFYWTDFTSAKMSSADLSGTSTYPWDPKYQYAWIEYPKLLGQAADFTNCNLSQSDLSNAVLLGACFRSSKLEEANLKHAEIERGKFSNADLNHANLNSAEIPEGDFSETDLLHADLREADIRGADLSEARILGADLSGSFFVRSSFPGAVLANSELIGTDLRFCEMAKMEAPGTDFTDADLRGANLRGGLLESATMIRTDIRGANLRKARLYEIHFSDVLLNDMTEFGVELAYEELDLAEEREIDSLEAASWVYRRLESLFEENAMAEEAREYHVRKQEARRKFHKQQDHYTNWLLLEASRWLTRHNDSPIQVIKVSLGVIFGTAFLYPVLGGVVDTGATTPAPRFGWFPILFEWTPPEPVLTFFKSLYFSIVTFTTLGFGDVQPATGAADALASIEAFAGALLMALLVFVLGRRTTW